MVADTRLGGRAGHPAAAERVALVPRRQHHVDAAQSMDRKPTDRGDSHRSAARCHRRLAVVKTFKRRLRRPARDCALPHPWRRSIPSRPSGREASEEVVRNEFSRQNVRLGPQLGIWRCTRAHVFDDGGAGTKPPAPRPAPDTPEPQYPKVQLTAGRSTVLSTPFDVTRIAVTSPDVADAVVVQPREILIDGKKAGTVSLIVWGPSTRLQYDVVVEQPITTLEQHLHMLFPGEDVTVGTSEGPNSFRPGLEHQHDAAHR